VSGWAEQVFEVGDKVKATREIGQKVPVGTSGRIVRIGGEHSLSPFQYGVEFKGVPFYTKEDPWPVMAYEIERTD
jgi:hypothetical protein